MYVRFSHPFLLGIAPGMIHAFNQKACFLTYIYDQQTRFDGNRLLMSMIKQKYGGLLMKQDLIMLSNEACYM